MRVIGKDDGGKGFRLVMNIEGGGTQQQAGLLNRQGKEEGEMAEGKSGQGKTRKGKGGKRQTSAKQGVECRKFRMKYAKLTIKK